MRIRRDTAGGTGDDDEADVSFDTSLSTPTISLDSAISNASSGVTATTFGEFVAASGYSNPDSLSGTILAYVDSWMDQSGNGNDAEQTTHGNQPQIYNGSAVITATNNIAAIKGIFANQTVLKTPALGVDFSGGYTWYNVFEDVGFNKHTFHFKYYNAQGSYGLRSVGTGTNAEHEGSNLVVSPATNTLRARIYKAYFMTAQQVPTCISIAAAINAAETIRSRRWTLIPAPFLVSWVHTATLPRYATRLWTATCRS